MQSPFNNPLTLMPPSSAASLVDALRQCRLLEPAQLEDVTLNLQSRFSDPKALAGELIRRGWLTPFQANQLLQGRGQELVLGSYVLMERLGEGGMGQVFKARHRNLGRIVALKLIRKERLDNPEAVRRFEREVRSAAALSHPNIVLAYDADQIDGTHLLVMEYVEGATDLSRLVKKHGPLPVAQACEYIKQAALGLQHAYERGMVHRDIKPHNLLLTAEGKAVKILDMGLARLNQSATDGDKSSTMTHEGAVMGTPDYIAPEQAVESHTVDIRADLYSLGCTFYYLLTGRVPFPTGSLIQKINKHQFEEPQAVERLRPDVPSGVARVVRKLMAKKPENRYQTPAEVVAALAEAGNNGSENSMAAGTADQTVGGLRRVVPVTASSSDTLPSAFSYMAHREDTAAMESPQRLRQKQQERRSLLLSVAGGSFVLVAFMVILFLAFKGPAAKQPSGNEGDHPVVAETTSQRTPAKVEDAWLKQVAAMSAEKQVEAVAKKLQELNPGFDGKVTHKIEDGVVTEVQFWSDNVMDISPVKALMKLQKLECGGKDRNQGAKFKDLSPLKGMSLKILTFRWSSVADLSPLQGMPLAHLECVCTQVSDLSSLQGLPLTHVNCERTPVQDLSPLKGMPLAFLSCGSTQVSDLSPLKGMPLGTLECHGTKVSELSALEGMPMTYLHCGATQVSDLSPLKGMKLTSLACEATQVSDLSPLKGMKLTDLHCGATQVSDLSPLKGMPLTTLMCHVTRVSDLSPLKDMKLTMLFCFETKVSDLSPLKGMPLGSLECHGTKVSDLSPLKGMPLTILRFYDTQIFDLSPLQGIKLTFLACNNTQISDLTPLKGMPLTALYFGSTKVSDLSPLKGMPLIDLEFFNTQVSDLSLLKEMPLKILRCDFKLERDSKLFRSIKTLETINGKPAVEFWKEVEATKPGKLR